MAGDGGELVGHAAPLLGDGSTAPPDQREVSLRYLVGTFLTGFMAMGLMGGALWGAAEGRVTVTADARPVAALGANGSTLSRSERLTRPIPTAAPTDRAIMSVPMLVPTEKGDEVRMRPFAHLTLALDAGHVSGRPTPRFDPASMFKPREAETVVPTGAIYGASVETDVRLRNRPMEAADLAATPRGLDPSVIVARVNDALSPEGERTRSLPFEAEIPLPDAIAALTLPASMQPAAPRARVIARNESVARARLSDGDDGTSERVVRIESDVSATLAALAPVDGDRFANALAALSAMGRNENGREAGQAGSALRVAFADDGAGSRRIVRAGLYDGADFRAAVALDDEGKLKPASMPSGPAPAAPAAKTERRRVLDRSLHEALHQTAYSYDLPDMVVSRIAELVSPKSDFRANVKADDEVEVLLALPEGATETDENAQMIYVSATVGGEQVTLYRHVSADGRAGWYDENGRGARPFLLRKPLSGGRFRSPYGMRRHPIRKRMRMHWGVDWAAPGGTPIYAAADGVVKEARWAGGNGRRTLITHANGYESSYSHQRRFAKGIKPGKRVKQGQVIGYVGTTGLSTGNHLHYELKVNGQRVDPMRVRLPASDALEGAELQRFADAKVRIDELLAKRKLQVVASN